MRLVLLIAAALFWFLFALGVDSENFSMVWVGASLIVLAFALDGVTMPWTTKKQP